MGWIRFSFFDAPFMPFIMVGQVILLVCLYYCLRKLAVWYRHDRIEFGIDVPEWLARILIAPTIRLSPIWAKKKLEDNVHRCRMSLPGLVFYGIFLVMSIDFLVDIVQYMHYGTEHLDYEYKLMIVEQIVLFLVWLVYYWNHGSAMHETRVGWGFFGFAVGMIIFLVDLLYGGFFQNNIIGQALYDAAPRWTIALDYQAPPQDHAVAADIQVYYEALLHRDAEQGRKAALLPADIAECAAYIDQQYKVDKDNADGSMEISLPQVFKLKLYPADPDAEEAAVKQAVLTLQKRSAVRVTEEKRRGGWARVRLSVDVYDFTSRMQQAVADTEQQAEAGAFANRAARQAFFSQRLQQLCEEGAPDGTNSRTFSCLYDAALQQWLPAEDDLQMVWDDIVMMTMKK